MGSLRFRKSISLCKGVRLNVGKTGVSISAGVPGFRKTIHSSGKVTTSVGIPGSGLYYVDTKNIVKKDTAKVKKTPASNRNSVEARSLDANQPAVILPEKQPYSTEPIKDTYDGVQRKIEVIAASEPTVCHLEEKIKSEKETADECQIDLKSYIGYIFRNCDLPVNWMDVASHREPVSSDYTKEAWSYLHKMAAKVFEDDIDTYLNVVNTINPYDDLLDYAKDFVVGINESGELEVEFTLLHDIIGDSSSKDFVELYHALSIRTARDTFALLPIEEVRVSVLCKKKELINKLYKRDAFLDVDFDMLSPTQIYELC